nr:ABC transporter substrate-binding protein [Pseudenhygromyxa sp. WMMC2535]
MIGAWQGLDPWEAQELAGVVVRNQCFETLYTRNAGLLAGDRRYLAEELRADGAGIGDARRFSLRLAEGLRFSDGSPVEPEDVAESLLRVAPLRAMAVIGAGAGRRVRFSCYDPDALLEAQLAQIWSVIGRRGPEFWLGTGPYRIVEEQRGNVGQVLVLHKNPNWIPTGATTPSIERVVFRTFPVDADGQPTALRDAIQSGEIDFTSMLPREIAKGLQGVRKVYQPGQSTAFLAFNCERPWLDEPAVRRALSAAIDPWAIARLSHDNPAAFAARGLLPPAMAPAKRSLPKYGQELAAAAFASLGARRSNLRMLTVWGPRPYLPNPRAVAQAIAAQFAKFDIRVEIEQARSAADFFDGLRAGEHDLILSGYIAETPDPVDFMTALLSSRRIPKPTAPMAATTNIGHYADPEMDRRLAAAQRDPAALARVDERFEDMRPLVPLMYGASVVVHSWRVQNFELDPRGIPSFAELSLD